MFGWIRDFLGGSSLSLKAAEMDRQHIRMREHFQKLRAKYDNAQTSGPNAKHFLEADLLGARAANNPAVRQKLRSFSRYEIANSSYAKGIILTIANELVGRGPRLQMRIPNNREANRQFEKVFSSWQAASMFNDKLHTMAQAAAGDGEGCGVMFHNPAIKHQVRLDISLVEADQLCSPWSSSSDSTTTDGIKFDQWGNPVSYNVLRQHPGEAGVLNAGKSDTIPAEFFLHWFRRDRPGQCRGVPWITPCLGLFAQLRRWTLAVLQSAETAASFSAILKTTGTPEATAQADPWDEVQINMGAFTTLPEGWAMEQMRAEQPIATYHMFKNEILKEIARCLNMPANIVMGDSSLMNYASGRLDFQAWYRMVKVIRAVFEQNILERVFSMWLSEAALIPRLLPAGVDLRAVPHSWFYDAVPHVDPVKDGMGDQLALANCVTTRAELCAAQGQDWMEVADQLSEETAYLREKGLDIYLPDFAMEVQRDIADSGKSDDGAAKAAQAAYFRNLIGGRN